MKRIAVIGSGIAGMSCAYYLSRRYEVFMFERDARIGGHTHTHTVETSAGSRAIDSGFIVHNERTYPNLIRLFRELGVETENSDMSFSVSDESNGREYSSRGLSGFFAARGNLLDVSHYRLLSEILRFNRSGRAFIRRLNAGAAASVEMPLSDFIRKGGHSPVLAERYLYPMASAVWSMSMQDIGDFPAVTLLRFFDNHGLLGINTHPQWKVVRGGSSRYIAPLTAPYHSRIITGVDGLSVERDATGVTLKSPTLSELRFDEVVFACPAAEALRCLKQPTGEEIAILQAFRTVANDAVLHSDSRRLPSRANARASWNYRLSSDSLQRPTLTYHMNRLQNLQLAEDYCVSINEHRPIDRERTIRRMVYHHPLYNSGAVRAQGEWSRVSGQQHTHFCGAYWFYGFHEDGLNSGMRVARSLGVEC